MAKYKEIVYLVLDEIKALNGDSTITEEHVIFLANQYRSFLLDLKIQKQGAHSLSSANKLVICLDLEPISANNLGYCSDVYLRSVLEIPDVLDGTTLEVQPPTKFLTNIVNVSEERFKFVGYNKYMLNIIYSALSSDKHLYFKSNNPLFMYLKLAKASGIFEDSSKATELACENSESSCDIMELEFPIETDLIITLVLSIVKELYGAEYRPNDTDNNAKDDLADIASFIRLNTKSSLAKLMTQ